MARRSKFYFVLIAFVFLAVVKTYAQSSCPENIGFENGNLLNWQCYIGTISRAGIIDVSPSAPANGRHDVIRYSPTAVDYFGKFPLTCPNGSLYSLKLGNEQIGAQAERVSYTFKVPADQKNFVIIYNYAVVFQNPDHQDYEQPKFTAKVFNVTSNKYVDCGSFEFVASSGLPGFQQSPVGSSVYYKPWAPITINLFGYEGQTLRLEFTTNDCTRGGHFGYAYIDVNENCKSPITGNVYCSGSSTLTMSAPAGFKEYYWYNEDFSQVLGNSNILKITPAPPDGTHYALRIVPYPGLGCEDTLYTTVNAVNAVLNLAVKDTIRGCESGVNLQADSVTAGSSSNLLYSYFSDPDAQNYVADPKQVTSSGKYYIKAENGYGCSDIKPVYVNLTPSPPLLITNPLAVCVPSTVDITKSSITAGSTTALALSYWKDVNASIPIKNPAAIDSSGTYFIQATSNLGCAAIKPVVVEIDPQPKLILNTVTNCGTADLTSAAVTAGSSGGLTYSYWLDTAATAAIANPAAVAKSGTYYIRGTNAGGCTTILPVRAEVYPTPAFVVKDPTPVVYPATVDLTKSYSGSDTLSYAFFIDQNTATTLANPQEVKKSGTYYILAKSRFGCMQILSVNVVINPPLMVKVVAPNTFTPNNDGINDLFVFDVEGVLGLHYFKIYNRYGQQIFETKQLNNFWDGTLNGSRVPAGVYYWVLDGEDSYRKQHITRSGSIAVIR